MISEDAYDVVFHIISELWENEMGFAATEKFKSLKLKIEKNVSARMDRYRGKYIFSRKYTCVLQKKQLPLYNVHFVVMYTTAGPALFRFYPQKELIICTLLAYQGFKSQKGIIP